MTKDGDSDCKPGDHGALITICAGQHHDTWIAMLQQALSRRRPT
jgi:hypothetical protein